MSILLTLVHFAPYLDRAVEVKRDEQRINSFLGLGVCAVALHFSAFFFFPLLAYSGRLTILGIAFLLSLIRFLISRTVLISHCSILMF